MTPSGSKRAQPNSPPATTAAAPPEPSSAASPVLKFLVAVLLAVRVMLPADDAALGTSLWLVQCWLLLGLLWALLSHQRQETAIRWDLWDGLVWGIVLGHWVSAAALLWSGGDLRAAVNQCWEWTGLGAAFFLVRQTIRTRDDAQAVVRVMVSLVVCLAAFGIWQHFVAYPEMQREYHAMRSEYDRLLTSAEARTLTPATAQRLRDLELQFRQLGVPTDGPGRELFEQRLTDSREPTGTWGLANTFAGGLAVWLIVGLAAGLSPSLPAAVRWLAMAEVAIIGYCLLLTKSRTAWVAVLLGVAVGIALWARRALSGIPRRKLWRMAAIGGGVVGGLLLVATVSGGLDWQVISESPKSLRYRFEFWTATWRMLGDRPVFGAGPGNFRQHYLAYKLPESSEEILDPHNLLLDLWASGGLLSLLLFFAAVGWGLSCWRRSLTPQADPATPRPEADDRRALDVWSVGTVAGLVLLMGFGMLLGSGAAEELVFLALSAAAVVLLQGAWHAAGWSVSNLPAVAWLAAGVLGVHLLGAGGVETPVIVQTALVLVACATVAPARQGTVAVRWGIAAIAAALFLGCLVTAMRPVASRNAFLGEAQYALYSRGDVAAARKLLREAAEADSWSPDPWRRRAELEFRIWNDDPADAASFERGVEALQEAIARDPWRSADHRMLGNAYRQRFEVEEDAEWAERAVEAYDEALRRYPTDAGLWGEFAVATEAAEQREKSRNAAKKAIALDALNRKQGHRDKYLEPEVLRRLEEIAGGR